MKFKVGDKVILGKHIDHNGDPYNWNPSMDQYVGKIATVTEVGNYGSSGSTGYDYIKVDLNPRWYWEAKHQKFAGSSRDPQNDGCRCSKCSEFVPYVEPSDTFVCYSCKRRP